MKNEFIPYEQALALKQLGFNEPCFGYYLDNEFQFFADVRSCNTNSEFGFYPTALTYSQAFRWLREKHGLLSIIDFNSSKNNGWYYSIITINVNISETDNKCVKTYEEAELACLKKLIEIVKSNTDTP